MLLLAIVPGGLRVSSYLSNDEVNALQSSGLHRKNPYAISGVCNTQLSIARHYGGLVFRGDGYQYIQESDELIRDDVLRWLENRRKEQSKVTAEVENKQKDIFE